MKKYIFYRLKSGSGMLTMEKVDVVTAPIENSYTKKKPRVQSIDLLRGTVMIIMAIDHVRHSVNRDAFLFDPLDFEHTSSALFLTRFITHYCAPVFVFLAGIAAYLSGKRKTKKELSRYLFARGLWLIFVEAIIITLGQTFNPTFPYITLQVIWAIGLCMIVMAGLVYLPFKYILLTAIAFVAGHNLLDTIHLKEPGFIWSALHEPGTYFLGGIKIYVKYPVIPWIGIMALGYCTGTLYEWRSRKRQQALLWIGLSAIALFLLLRYYEIYGDPSPWAVQRNNIFTVLSFINVTKYPPSLLYTLITLGPALIFLSLTERPLNKLTEKIAVFGRVPFFYYVLHIYVIHLITTVCVLLSGYNASVMILKEPLAVTKALKGFGYDLTTTYAIWAGLILLLYPFCKWFDKYKKEHQATRKWLTYV